MDESITTCSEQTTPTTVDDNLYKTDELTTDYELINKPEENANSEIRRENDNFTMQQNLDELIEKTNNEAENLHETTEIITETVNNCDSNTVQKNIIADNETTTNLICPETTNISGNDNVEEIVENDAKGTEIEEPTTENTNTPKDVSIEDKSNDQNLEETRNEITEENLDEDCQMDDKTTEQKLGEEVIRELEESQKLEETHEPEEIQEQEQVQKSEEIQQPDEEGAVVEEQEGEKVVEVIEIRELETAELIESNKTEQTAEYTVIESQTDDLLLKQTNKTNKQLVNVITEDGKVIETTNDKVNDETVFLINYATTTEASNIELELDEDESSQEYNVEEVFILNEEQNTSTANDDDDEDDDDKPILSRDEQIKRKLIEKIKTSVTKTPKPRGRKPIRDIPLHVLGRDITKPTESVHNGGRNLPKPRLGVKVPYRNLTSQIVSKEEIQKEIMDRFKSKQEQNSAGDIFFARKLTQRLARKLTTTSNKNDKIVETDELSNAKKVKLTQTTNDASIKDNSDLIAILEGDDDYYSNNTNASGGGGGGSSNNNKNDKEREIEIALQQLNELPMLPLTGTGTATTKKRIFKSRDNVVNSPTANENKSPKTESINETNSTQSDNLAGTSTGNQRKSSQEDVEPRLKTGVVLKTYTRKRKSSEIEQPTTKKVVTEGKIEGTSSTSTPTTTTSSDVYITKSSRVSKRKVIWDPDEVKATPNKNLIKSPKHSGSESSGGSSSSSTSTIKSSKNSNNNNNNLDKTPSPIIRKSNASGAVTKKRLTEVDRLLMDEGAVNMLYDVKNTTEHNEQNKQVRNKKSKMISLDKAHKELMTKTVVIKNDLQQNVNKQKLLRKKDFSTPSLITRQTSLQNTNSGNKKKLLQRDGNNIINKNVLNTPPASPAYQHHAEASRIISRHSSSSFSSSDELIIEDDNNINDQKSVNSNKKKAEKLLDSVKKKIKKTAASSSSGNSHSTSNNEKHNNKNSNNNNNHTNDNSMNETEFNNKFEQFKCFRIEQNDKLVKIQLDNKSCNSYLTLELLLELTTCLNKLSNDDTCQAVTITSNVITFSRGLEYRSLVSDDEDLRKKKANELANCVKDFLLCLLNFQKILIAGIQGDCLGLGVTMLPLFDMVIASDVATFSTPYASLGCVAEGGYLLTVPHLTSHGLASELLFTSQVLKADDAFRRGLITRLCWPEKYDEEFKTIVGNVAKQSMQSTMASKKLLRQNLFEMTESAINNDTQVLINHWISPECQINFNKYKVEVE